MTVLGSFGETNPGKKRRRNEDAFVCDPPLFAVADGMGGAQAGEVASSLAAASVSAGLGAFDEIAAGDAEKIVVGLIRDANRLVHQRATHDAAASGMGTTMTVALAAGDHTVAIGHVGDSRAYLLRDGALEQLTDDHSLVAELVRRGELSPAEAEVHPQRSVITRALGTDPDVEVDVFSLEARDGDVFLLCSDGLSTMVDTDAIGRIVDRHDGNLEEAAHELIRAANEGGGDDNVTAVLFQIGGVTPSEAETVISEPEPDPEPEPEAQEPAATAAEDEDEDTLHPEDRVPVIEWPPPAAAAPDPAPEEAPPAELAEGDTFVLTADAVRAAVEAAEPDRPSFPVMRAFVSTLLILGLAAAIVALGLWGIAR